LSRKPKLEANVGTEQRLTSSKKQMDAQGKPLKAAARPQEEKEYES